MTAVVEPCPGLAREALADLILLPFNLNFKMWHLTWIQHREQSYAQWRGCGKNIRPTEIGSPLNGSGFFPQITNFPLKVCMKITKINRSACGPLHLALHDWLEGSVSLLYGLDLPSLVEFMSQSFSSCRGWFTVKVWDAWQCLLLLVLLLLTPRLRDVVFI